MPVCLAALASAGCGPEGSDAGAGEAGGESEPPPAARDQLTPDDLGGLEAAQVRLTMPWTSGTINRAPSELDTLRTVRRVEVIRHTGFDRVLLELEGVGTFVGYHVEPLAQPPSDCETGEPVEESGIAWIQLHLSGARARDQSGFQLADAELPAGEGTILAMHRICDREEEVEWALGVADSGAYRVMELVEPLRLVLDVRN